MFYKSHRGIYGNNKGKVTCVKKFRTTCVYRFTTEPNLSMITFYIIEQY